MAAYLFNKDVEHTQMPGKLLDFQAPSSELAARGVRGASRISANFPLEGKRSDSSTSSIYESGESKGRISKALHGRSEPRSESLIEFASYEELTRQLKKSEEFDSLESFKRHLSLARMAPAQRQPDATPAELAGDKPSAKKGPSMKVINPTQIKLKTYQVKELNETFDILADPNTGMVHVEDLTTILRACGSEPKDGEVDEILDKIHLTNPGYLTLNEIIEVFKYKLVKNDETPEIERAFRRMNFNSGGPITFSDLKQVAELVSFDISDQQLEEMIAAIDKTGEGVKLENFVKFMTKKEYYDF